MSCTVQTCTNVQIVSIPKGAIMSKFANGYFIVLVSFNSKRCDYENAYLTVREANTSCFNSKRCDYETTNLQHGRYLYNGFNSKRCDYERCCVMFVYCNTLFQFQKVRL